MSSGVWIFFISDALVNGRRIRVLTIVDDFSREGVYIGLGSHFRGIQMAELLANVSRRRSVPKKIQVDNGPEFTSVALDGGPIGMRSSWYSQGQPLQQITRISSNLMHACDRNALMRIDLNRSRRHEVKSRRGSINITRNILTVR